MFEVTVRGIVAHRVRLVLSAVAIMLGVAFVSGSYVLTDTLDRSYDGLFSDTVDRVDLVVRLRDQSGPEGTRERFPDHVLEQLAAIEGVESAHGVVQGYAQLVDRAGEAVRAGGAPTLGISWAQDGDRGPLRLIGSESRPPRGSGEVAIDIDTAREHGFRVGDRVRVLLTGPAKEYRVSGLFGFGDRVDLGAVTFVAFDLPTAQAAVGAPGEVDAVNVVAAPGIAPDQLRDRLSRALGPSFAVMLAREAAADAGVVVRDLIELLTQILLGFAAIGVVIAALLVFNTFSIVAAQRTRELGLLRVLGASRSQVVTAIMAEALAVAVVASAAGLVLGVGVAALLLPLVERLGFDIPAGGVVVLTRTAVVAVGVGVAVTLVAALWPAIRASRDAPLVVSTGTQPVGRDVSPIRVGVGVALLVVAVPLVVIGFDRAEALRRVTTDLGWVAAGAIAVLLGVVVLLATFAGPLAGALGRPGARFGVAGHLARENAVRNPRRTAATASALVIGLTLVSLAAILADSTKASVRASVDRGIRADGVLKAQRFARFSPEIAPRVAEVPGVEAVSPLQVRRVRILGNEETVASAEAGGLTATVDLDLERGSVADLEPRGILVHEDAARDYGVEVGDVLVVQMSRGSFPLQVAGIYRQADFTGGLPISFIVPRDVYRQGFGADEQDQLVYLTTAGEPERVLSDVRRALGDDFPNVDVLSRAQYRDDQERAVDRFLAVTVALLLLAQLIAVLGIVNTLALSVFERTREVGLLRAVGMSAIQVRQMVRGEAAVIAALGSVVGMAVGVVWGWLFTTALRSQGVTEFRIPVLQLAVFLVVALLASWLAAWFPARRASRLDVLAAIATE